jgi:hypothetical protein
MITTADTLEIMTVVAACHPRTAPRIDDREVALATAGIWVELLAEFDFSKDELISAVKSRAKVCSEAPEVADVIRVARSRRSEQMARTGVPSPAGIDGKPEHYPGDAKAAADLPDYPAGWTAEQRMTAYWYVIRERHTWPATTDNWRTILHLAQRPRARDEADA